MTATVLTRTNHPKAPRKVYRAPMRELVLKALYNNTDKDGKRLPMTTTELGVTAAFMLSLESPDVGAPVVRRCGHRPSSSAKGGRPSVLWCLTDAGRKRIGQAVGDLDRKGKKIS